MGHVSAKKKKYYPISSFLQKLTPQMFPPTCSHKPGVNHCLSSPKKLLTGSDGWPRSSSSVDMSSCSISFTLCSFSGSSSL